VNSNNQRLAKFNVFCAFPPPEPWLTPASNVFAFVYDGVKVGATGEFGIKYFGER
jgi:hypothetical protein